MIPKVPTVLNVSWVWANLLMGLYWYNKISHLVICDGQNIFSHSSVGSVVYKALDDWVSGEGYSLFWKLALISAYIEQKNAVFTWQRSEG